MGVTTAVLLTGGYMAHEQKKAQEDALEEQRRANREAEARMRREEERRDKELKKVSAKKPDISSLIGNNATKKKGTNLTGQGGVDPSTLMLGKTSLLGA